MKVKPFQLVALLVGLALAACSQSDFGKGFPTGSTTGPGQAGWNDDPTCSSDSDCLTGETCINNTCQMRCCANGPYRSVPPIGKDYILRHARQLLVADSGSYQNSYWVDGYGFTAPVSGPRYVNSWASGNAALVDVAGGNLIDGRPEELVLAHSGTPGAVAIEASGTEHPLSFSFVPVAVGAGDVDGDHLDEVIALSATAQVAVCKATDGTCREMQIGSGGTGIDVVVADVDGDGYDEPVFVLNIGGSTYLYVWNLDTATTGQAEVIGSYVDEALDTITAGNVAGDGSVILVGHAPGGYLQNGQLTSYKVLGAGVQKIASTEVRTDIIDVSLADVDGDGKDELMLLRSDGNVDVYSTTAALALTGRIVVPLSTTTTPKRLATTDFEGKSASARLVGGPDQVAGTPVPTAVVYLPPYDRDHSEGKSSVSVGFSSSTSTGVSTSISASTSWDLGLDAGVQALMGTGLRASIGKGMSTSSSVSTSLSISPSFGLSANPERYGANYAAVALSSACFQAYYYQMDDPTGLVGADGSRMVVTVPVDGNWTLWSSNRYNAMAKAVPGLPLMNVQAKLGDVSSYPSSPLLPDGTPIPVPDLVFPNPPQYLVSDIAGASWFMTSGSSTSTDNSTSTSASTGFSSSLPGFSFGTGQSTGSSTGYSISVGKSVVIAGDVPPIPDNPSTPEDEYQLYKYTFSPVLYRNHYTDGDGKAAGYYTLIYTVGR